MAIIGGIPHFQTYPYLKIPSWIHDQIIAHTYPHAMDSPWKNTNQLWSIHYSYRIDLHWGCSMVFPRRDSLSSGPWHLLQPDDVLRVVALRLGRKSMGNSWEIHGKSPRNWRCWENLRRWKMFQQVTCYMTRWYISQYIIGLFCWWRRQAWLNYIELNHGGLDISTGFELEAFTSSSKRAACLST